MELKKSNISNYKGTCKGFFIRHKEYCFGIVWLNQKAKTVFHCSFKGVYIPTGKPVMCHHFRPVFGFHHAVDIGLTYPFKGSMRILEACEFFGIVRETRRRRKDENILP